MAGRWYEPRAFPRHALESGQWLLVAFAGLLFIWSVTQTGVSGFRNVNAALSFGALIAFGELLRLNLPGEREAAPINLGFKDTVYEFPGGSTRVFKLET